MDKWPNPSLYSGSGETDDTPSFTPAFATTALYNSLTEQNRQPIAHKKPQGFSPKYDDVMQRNSQRRQLREYEEEYYKNGAYSLDVLGWETKIPDEEIYERLNLNHCVKRAPTLPEIVEDTSRTNPITYIPSRHILGAKVDQKGLPASRCTEHEALTEYYRTVNDYRIRTYDSRYGNDKSTKSLTDNLVFIGEKELEEAAKGISIYWKEWLDDDVDRQLLILGGAETSDGRNKSSIYILDRIMQFFTDSEMQKYKNRLITRDGDVKDSSPEALKAVLVDDWIISGIQMQKVAGDFLRRHPHREDCLEVNLLCASQKSLSLGLGSIFGRSAGGVAQMDINLPVKAYYAAIHGEELKEGVHITGSHSSVDFGFENEIADRRITDGNQLLPPLVNIVRPYRLRGYEPTNIIRMNKIMDYE